MRTIWKFPIRMGEQIIEVPGGTRIFSAGVDPQGQPNIWGVVNPEADPGKRRVFLAMTGRDLPDWVEAGMFVGTFNMGPLVCHVFQEVEA